MFKKLELCDKKVFDDFLGTYPFYIYDYSFANLYLWRNMCGIEYDIMYDSLVITMKTTDLGTCFMLPISKTYIDDCSLKEILKFLACNYSDSHILLKVDNKGLKRLKMIFNDNIYFEADIDEFDYIYDAYKLKTLSGRKLNKKRNHYNQFKNNFNYELKSIDDERTTSEVLNFLNTWYDSKIDKTEELDFEKDYVPELLYNKNYLNLDALALYVDNKVIGFTIGEKVSKDMAIIHTEKCDTEYCGSYNFINRSFIEMFYSDVLYINRQEDMGIPGLKKTKLSYHPEWLEAKYLVSIRF